MISMLAPEISSSQNLPRLFCSDTPARYLKQTVWAEIRRHFFHHAGWTPDGIAVIAKVERAQRKYIVA
jgi:hypothetical protein